MAEQKNKNNKKKKEKAPEAQNVLDDNKLNVLLLGTSGAGKSTLINAFVDTNKEEAKTGTGSATTHFINVYGDRSGLDFRMIDTPGFEYSHKSQAAITKDLKRWLKDSVKHPDPKTVIHTIWFCVDGQQKKLNKETIDYIRTVTKFWKDIPIILVSTKTYFQEDIADNNTMIDSELKKYKDLDELNVKEIVHVLALKKGDVEPFGLDDLKEATERYGPEAKEAFEKNWRIKNCSSKRASAQKIVAAASATAAGADVAKKGGKVSKIIQNIQSGMLYELANIYEVKDDDAIKEIINHILEESVIANIGKKLAELAVPVAKKKFKIAKKVVTASVSGVITAIVGELGILVFESIYTGSVDVNDTDWSKYIDKLLKDKKLSKRIESLIKSIKKKDSSAAVDELNNIIEKMVEL